MIRTLPRRLGGLVLIASTWAVQAAAQDTLTRAKDYYASASYDDALRVIGQIRAHSKAAPADLAAYEVFCLFALGRDLEAREAVEQLVRADPLYRPSAEDVSPRVRAFFDDVRRPLLPAMVRQIYSEAREDLDRKEIERARAGFDRVLKLVDELGPSVEVTVADLRLLARGFLDLAVAEPSSPVERAAAIGDIKTGPEPPPASAPEVGSPPSPAAQSAPDRIYTADDADVVPPQVVSRTLPPWQPTNPVDRLRAYRGQLELLIETTGRVSTITVNQGVHADYDVSLLRAAGDWRFAPATRDGQPVRYRLTVDIVLAGKP